MIDQQPPIQIRRLHRFFGNTRAVDDVSFEVRRGHVCGFIGPNGAGKTTTMRILATLDLPSAGDALIDGFSVVNDPDKVRRRVGFMPDQFGTYPNVNCWEYLDFFARSYGFRGASRHRRLDDVMTFTGLDVLAEKSIRSLSKGMKQRLCLGRAMIHDPAVLILDEPAAGLDPRARVELRQMIRQLSRRGKTVLISSHILTELAEMCDEVAIIEQGRLLAVGHVDQIKQGTQPHRLLRARVVGPVEATVEWLRERLRPEVLRIDGERIVFAFQGNPAEQVELLRGLIEAGFPIAELADQTTSLEDVFMEVTKGFVQ